MATITQTGAESWRVQIRRKGIKSLCRTFRTKAEAEKWARRTEADLDEGRGIALPSDVTVAQAIEAFRVIRQRGTRPVKVGSAEDYMLKNLERDLGRERYESLTPDRLSRWARFRHDEGAGPVTVAMELSKLGSVGRYGSIELKVTLRDVAAEARPALEHLNLIGPSAERDRRIAPDEEARLLAMAPDWWRPVFLFAIATGMRRGEILGLTWVDIDADKRLAFIRDRKDPRRKIGNHMRVPLLDDAWAIIESLPRGKPDERLFPFSGEQVSDTMLMLCRAADIADLHFHDTRHEAISRLFELGLTIPEVAAVSGHKRWDSLRKYTNIRPESLHARVAGMRPGAPPRHADQRSDDRLPCTSAPDSDPATTGSAATPA